MHRSRLAEAHTAHTQFGNGNISIAQFCIFHPVLPYRYLLYDLLYWFSAALLTQLIAFKLRG